jgi:hypothetical protein
MKRKRNFLKSKNVVVNTSPEIKMSELIEQYAADYIDMGDTTEERESLLNVACSAWNIAVLPDHLREGAIRQSISAYNRMNPGNQDAVGFEKDLRDLIAKKLKMFPDIKKVIIDAMIEAIGDMKYRINIASSKDQELLKHLLGGSPK